jgi:hypothetical protein
MKISNKTVDGIGKLLVILAIPLLFLVTYRLIYIVKTPASVFGPYYPGANPDDWLLHPDNKTTFKAAVVKRSWKD